MYDARIRNHILPVFGTHPVRTLTYDQLEEFFKVTLPAKDLGVSSIRQTFVAFKSALDYYQRDRIITAHPMTGLKVPRAKVLDKKDKTQIRRASKFLNQHLLKWARQEDAEARWFLALLGLRQGEVLGMTDDSLVTRGSGSSRTRRVVVHVDHGWRHLGRYFFCLIVYGQGGLDDIPHTRVLRDRRRSARASR
jgi:integrase